MSGAPAKRDPAPTDDLAALAAAAQAAKALAGATRFLAACALAFAGLLLVALALAAFERTGGEEPAQTSASAFLDFDLSVLRALADRSLRSLRSLRPASAGEDPGALVALWARRPDWQLPRAAKGAPKVVSASDAWAAVASEKSRFRTAASGAASALPFLIGGLLLALLAAGAASLLAEASLWHERLATARTSLLLRAAVISAMYLLVLHPVWPLLDAKLFTDRTRSLGLGFAAALFVAAFAGTISGAAARSFFARSPHARHLTAISGPRALLTVARLAVLDATDWLVPLVPLLAAAAVFVCAKADQDPAVQAASNGLGALIRSAMREPSAAERLGSSALVAGALVVLWYLGHRFVLEVRAVLGAVRSGP
jgi:hypothetical protein